MSGDGGDRGAAAKWIDKHRRLYDQATRHPFICSIKDGSVNISAFRRWLAQDYIFVREFIPFVASVLLKACKQSGDRSDVDVVLGGIAALNDEVSWFRKEASKWGVSLDADPQKANLEYCRFLQGLTLPDVDYSVAMIAFWAIETVYQESFSFCLESGSKTPEELLETCHRWGNACFGQYCRSLERIVDRCLGASSPNVVSEAEEVFICVLNHETNFWNMSVTDLTRLLPKKHLGIAQCGSCVEAVEVADDQEVDIMTIDAPRPWSGTHPSRPSGLMSRRHGCDIVDVSVEDLSEDECFAEDE